MPVGTKIAFIFVTPLLLALGGLSSAQLAPALDPADALQDHIPAGVGRSLVMNTCNTCHPIERAVAEHRPADVWRAYIEDMRGRGAQANDKQVQIINSYLSRHFGQVNVNTAPKEELQAVLGITTAQADALIVQRAKKPLMGMSDLPQITGLDAASITF